MPSRNSWLLLVVCAAAGCDLGGQYEQKFQAALQNSAKQAVFEGNLHTTFTDIVDANRQPVGAKLRLPKLFDGNSKTMPQLAVPGAPDVAKSAYTLAREVDDPSGQKYPWVVSLTAMPKGDQKADAFQNFAKGIQAFMPGATVEDVTFNSPTGQTIACKRIRMDRPPLPLGKGGATIENRMDQYVVDAGGHLVMVTWMTPKALAAQLDPAIEASMGTIELAAAPSGAGPDAGKAGGPPKIPIGCM